MFVGYSKDHKTNVYCMLNVNTLKIKNTRYVDWINKSYREWKGIKVHNSINFEIAEESSSETDLSKSKEDKSSMKGRLSSNISSINEGDESSNLSHVTNCTCSKLSQQAGGNLVREMNKMCITKNAALIMQDITKWCMLGVKGADYVNPATFNKAWNHQDDNKHGE